MVQCFLEGTAAKLRRGLKCAGERGEWRGFWDLRHEQIGHFFSCSAEPPWTILEKMYGGCRMFHWRWGVAIRSAFGKYIVQRQKHTSFLRTGFEDMRTYWRLRQDRSQDFSKGGSHCVKVRVLTRLSLWPWYRHGIFATCCRLFG